MGTMIWALAKRIPWQAWAILAVLAVFSGYRVRHWWDQRQLAHVTVQRDQARADLHQATETQAASTQARQANDERIPEVRHATAGRIARADRATDAERLRDDADALAAYAAAADRLRGKSAR